MRESATRTVPAGAPLGERQARGRRDRGVSGSARGSCRSTPGVRRRRSRCCRPCICASYQRFRPGVAGSARRERLGPLCELDCANRSSWSATVRVVRGPRCGMCSRTPAVRRVVTRIVPRNGDCSDNASLCRLAPFRALGIEALCAPNRHLAFGVVPFARDGVGCPLLPRTSCPLPSSFTP
jgi:hypothetical protein